MSGRSVSLSFVVLFAAACEENRLCAQGPAEIRDEAVDAVAGEAIDAYIPFETEDSRYTHVEAEEAPEGLLVDLGADGVVLTGEVATPGSYSFSVVVEEEAGDVCAGWARYDVTLSVE